MTLSERFTRFAKRQCLWHLTPVKYNFMRALSDGDLDAVKQTVGLFPEAIHWEGGKSMYGTWEGNTALMTAFWGRNCSGGNVRLMNYLIDLGAEVNRQDKYGNTVLHRAAEQGDAEAIYALILQGADPDLRNSRGKDARALAVKASKSTFNEHKAGYYLEKIAEAVQQRAEALQQSAKICTEQIVASCIEGTQEAVPVRNRPLKLKKSKITY